MSSIKSRENGLRRHLSRLGYRLRKMPARSWRRAYYAVGYQILDSRNTVQLGCDYDATIEQVEAFLAAEGQRVRVLACSRASQ